MATKHPRASSSTQFDHTRFISAEAEARFQASITKRLGIKEQGIELDVKIQEPGSSLRQSKSTGGSCFADT